MKYEKLRIIITNRNTKEYLETAIKSIRKNEYFKNDIVIYDDNSTDDSRKWIVDNSDKYNYSFIMINETCKEGYDRMGITGAYNLAVDESPYDVPIMLGHSDMYYCKDFDKNILKHTGKRKIVSATRIEPPLHPKEPKVKYTKDFGMYPNELVENELDIWSYDKVIKNKDKYTNGVFAPMTFFKSDWNDVGGINKEFYPQSREDSEIWSKWLKEGLDFIQVWDSLVYHFTCRGSRFKDNLEPSEEWKASNKKNLANYQRIWGEYPRYTETHLPTIPHEINKITLVSLTKNNESTIQKWLEYYEPFVDEIILLDDNSTDDTINIAKNYFNIDLKDNSLVSEDKLKVVSHDLNKDFGSARNLGASMARNDWVIQIDQDEWFDEEVKNLFNWLVISLNKNKQQCVAFPRKNFIDGVLINDVPREQRLDYVKSVLDKKSDVKGETEIKYDPDLQCRLHHKDVKWIRPVHEMLEPFYAALTQQDQESAKKVMIFGEGFINHYKSSTEQENADNFYETISEGASLKPKAKVAIAGKNDVKLNGKPILIYNSVLFTNEGISKHAREEIKELQKTYDVVITSDVPENLAAQFGEMRAKLDLIDFEKDDYIYFINQPPLRPNDPSKSLLGHKGKKNIVYFLAMEGSRLPNEWTDAINETNPKVLLTPSKFCKDMFEKSGVKVPIEVIPHGVDSETIKSCSKLDTLPDEVKDKTTFLWAGTYRGTDKHDRKGFNVMLDAWEKFCETDESKDCLLVLKISNAYYQGDTNSWRTMIGRRIENIKSKVVIIDDILSDKDMIKLIKSVNCYVNPALSEGFGMIALEALACGTPVIATDTSGMKDFLTEDNSLKIKVLRQVEAENVYPYRNAEGITKFDLPSTVDLVNKLKEFTENKDKYKDIAVKESENILDEYSWIKVVKKFNEVFKRILDV